MLQIVLLCTSRGDGLKNRLEHSLPETILKESTITDLVIKGGKLNELMHRGQLLIQSLPAADAKLVFILGGYCDITTKLKKWNYEEVIFNNEVSVITSQIMDTILELFNTFNSLPNTYTVMSTVISGNIEIWNNTRLAQHKTTHLIHQKEYPTMQRLIHDCLVEINSFIVETNIQNGTITPFTHRINCVSRKRKLPTSKQTYKYSYNNLPDGVHLNEKLQEQLVKILVHSLEINIKELFGRPRPVPVPPIAPQSQAISYFGGNKSPKRSWMY
jgi:hypothetical protein